MNANVHTLSQYVDASRRDASTADDSESYDLDRYGKILSDVMRCPLITMQAKALYGVLATYVGGRASGKCWPTLTTLCDNTGMSRPMVIRYLDELEYFGVIERVGNANNREFALCGKVDLTTLNKQRFQPKKAVSSKTDLTSKTELTGGSKTHLTTTSKTGFTTNGVITESNNNTHEERVREEVSTPSIVDQVAAQQGWTTDTMPIFNAFVTWTGKAPEVSFVAVIQRLLMPVGSGVGAQLSEYPGKVFNGFSVSEVAAAVESLKMEGHNSPASLVKHVAGLMKPKQVTISRTGNGRQYKQPSTKPRTLAESRESVQQRVERIRREREGGGP